MAGILDMLKGQQPDQPSQGGLLAGGGGQFSERLSDMFAGLAMGADPNQSLSRAGMMIAQGNQLRREKSQTTQRANQTAAWLQSQGLGEQEASYLATDPDALRAWYKEFKSGNQPDWQITDMFDDQGRKIKAMVDKKTGKWNQIGGAEDTSKSGDVEYGLNPQYGVDKDGNPVILQLSKAGTSQQTRLPEGVTLSKEPIKLDAGTEWVLLDPITRQPVGRIPKENRAAASETAIGTAQGKALGEATAALPNVIAGAEQTLAIIDDLKTDPNRERATGKTSVFNSIPGTGAYDYNQKVLQLKGKAFLEAYQGLKGTGAISEIEGQKAEQAVARIDTAQTEEGFLKALTDLEEVVKTGIGRAKLKASGGAPSVPAMPSSSSPQAPSQGGAVPYTDYFK